MASQAQLPLSVPAAEEREERGRRRPPARAGEAASPTPSVSSLRPSFVCTARRRCRRRLRGYWRELLAPPPAALLRPPRPPAAAAAAARAGARRGHRARARRGPGRALAAATAVPPPPARRCYRPAPEHAGPALASRPSQGKPRAAPRPGPAPDPLSARLPRANCCLNCQLSNHTRSFAYSGSDGPPAPFGPLPGSAPGARRLFLQPDRRPSLVSPRRPAASLAPEL